MTTRTLATSLKEQFKIESTIEALILPHIPKMPSRLPWYHHLSNPIPTFLYQRVKLGCTNDGSIFQPTSGMEVDVGSIGFHHV